MDPTVWAGLVTLVVLEIVLGIDNLVFIAILAEKLPKHQRDRARVIGLSLALLMRLLLLTCISYLITLTTPLFIIAGFSFSGRKLIMLAGGIFLLYKATTELNEHLEGRIENENKQRKTARFWPVVAQIVVLDAVFSIDSVITAVGMVHHLPVMMIAVCIAIGLMIWASKPLTQFVTTRPTLIILCLSFLLMIGFSLVAEGFSFEIPKSYLYAAIGFSILIELFNQLSRFNRRRFLTSDRPLRQRTAEAVLRMLGGNHHEEELDEHSANLIYDSAKKGETFNQQERDMIERVLGFGLRNVGSIMTSRHDIELLDINDTNAEILTCLENNQHSRLVVMDSAASDEPLGVIYVNDLLKQQLQNEVFDLSILIKQPLIFPVKASLLMALEQFRQAKTHFAFIVDEFGATEGIVTLTDVLETIAGGLPVEGEEFDPRYDTLREDDGSWVVSGYIPLEDLTKKVPISIEEKRDYHTLAGLLLENMQHIPNQGDYVDIDGLRFTILEVENHRIVNVRITPIAESSLDAPIDG